MTESQRQVDWLEETKRDNFFSRAELQEIVDRAVNMIKTTGMDPMWRIAYQQMAMAADTLDSFLARCELVEVEADNAKYYKIPVDSEVTISHAGGPTVQLPLAPGVPYKPRHTSGYMHQEIAEAQTCAPAEVGAATMDYEESKVIPKGDPQHTKVDTALGGAYRAKKWPFHVGVPALVANIEYADTKLMKILWGCVYYHIERDPTTLKYKWHYWIASESSSACEWEYGLGNMPAGVVDAVLSHFGDK